MGHPLSQAEDGAGAGGEEAATDDAPVVAPAPADRPETAEPPVAMPEVPVTPARQVASILLGSVLAALTDLIVFATRPHGRAPLGVRVPAELISAGYLLGIGALMAAGVAVWRRFGPRSRVAAYAVITAVSWALGYVFYGEDLSGLADTLAKRMPFHPLRMAFLTLGLSLSVPIAVYVGRRQVRLWHWSVGLVAGVVGVIANGIEHDYPEMHLFITASYPGVHVLVAVLAVIVAAASFERAPVPSFARAARARAWAALAGVAVVWGALGLAVRPSNAVLLELQRYPGAVLFPFIGRLRAGVRGTPNVPAGKAAWFADRGALPAVPPSATGLLPVDPIVILLGIDSMRADVLADEKYREDLPELFRLRDESVYFANARSAGSSTAPSISSLFADRYYSQLYWSRTSEVDTSLLFPHADTSTRFPQLLTDAGIYTYTSDGTSWLVNSLGIVRGFGDEDSRRHGDYTRAELLLAPVIARLRKRERNPQFYFVHMLDAHSPYTSAGKRGSPFLGYVAELSRVDREIARMMKTLESKKLLRRACVIIMADHGEAFGEHGTRRHAVSLYDELLRVPLIVRLPSGEGRVVNDPVSLIDLAPTILDLMGVATPGRYMGQSLTGYLRGESPKLERPIVAEARLKRSMILPDGFKVIYDTLTQVVEIYDIANDPKEENNLYREGDPLSAERLGALNSFFEAQTLRRPGYKVPYRKW